MAALSPTHKAIAAYYAELEQYRAQGVTHELALKTAFQSLLATVGVGASVGTT